MREPLSATADEVVDIMKDLFPDQMERAMACLTIRKQQERIRFLESQLVVLLGVNDQDEHAGKD